MFRIIIIDDNVQYRKRVAQALEKFGVPGENIHRTASVTEAMRFSPGADMIVLDNLNTRSGADEHRSYWLDLLAALRTRHPGATIVLVSRREERALRKDIEDVDAATEHVLQTDPMLFYLSKGGPKEAKGDYGADVDHYLQIAAIAQDIQLNLKYRRHLLGLLVRSALEGAAELMGRPLAKLTTPFRQIPEEQQRYAAFSGRGRKGKEDTLLMDVIAEGVLSDNLLSVMHQMDVVICTEEVGVHNDFYHRIANPSFFVFSDPFDGSSRFEDAVDLLKKRGLGDRTFGQALADGSLTADWPCGPTALNSPMISMVLAERHRVVGAVLLNLFTQDLYVSTDTGNYVRNCGDDLRSGSDAVRRAVEEIRPLLGVADVTDPPAPPADQTQWLASGWQAVTFRKFHGPAPVGDRQKALLFLCSLGTVDRKERMRVNWINTHAELCVHPLVPEQYNWFASFNYRYRQRDFTPGPGRILFLTDTEACQDYNRQALRDNSYQCILSAGEPVTEWIGWFAFLRHAKGVSAYCLREKLYSVQDGAHTGARAEGELEAATRPPCAHRRPGDPPSISALPDEMVSIFRDGYMDLGVLHTAYAANMRRYKDTIAVVFDGDDAWQQKAVRPDGRPRFVKIPLMQLP